MQTKQKIFLESLPEESKAGIPLPVFHASPLGTSIIIVDKSRPHHTDQLACFWFYKPISKMYKAFEE